VQKNVGRCFLLGDLQWAVYFAAPPLSSFCCAFGCRGRAQRPVSLPSCGVCGGMSGIGSGCQPTLRARNRATAFWALCQQVGTFGGDNRAGIDRTLHRISCIRNRAGRVIGLTCVGRLRGCRAACCRLASHLQCLAMPDCAAGRDEAAAPDLHSCSVVGRRAPVMSCCMRCHQ